MAKKNSVFDLSGISIIACDCLQAIICIFIDLFFVSKILHLEGISVASKITSIGLFYVVYYLVLGCSYLVSGYALRKINKSLFVSLGSIVLTCVVLMVYLLQDNLYTFVPLIAFVYGIGFSFFSGGYNSLTQETISSKHQVKFFAVKKIMFQAVYIAFPITLGVIADIDFSYVTYIMFGIGALLIVFSFLIKPKKSFNQSFNLPKFFKYMKENKETTKPLWLVYVQTFFRGASYDCFTTLITILVISTLGQDNSKLGMFQSIFTACSLVTMFFYLKFYRKKRAPYFILPTIILVSCTIIAILAATTFETVVLFYAVYVILNVILMSISDSRRAGVVRVLSLHSHILESNAFNEFFLAVGRILGSLLLVFAGLFDGLVGQNSSLFLKIALGIVCLLYCGYGISTIVLEKALIKQDERFRQEHLAENIERTEE